MTIGEEKLPLIQQTTESFCYAGEMVCPVCGKTFPYTGQWYWVCRGKKCCTYGCMRKLENKYGYRRYRPPEDGEEETPENFKRGLTAEEKAAVLNLHREGRTVVNIAQAIGLTGSSRDCQIIRSYLKYNGLAVNTKRIAMTGQVGEIIRMRREGGSLRDIAKRFSISRPTVTRILRENGEE